MKALVKWSEKRKWTGDDLNWKWELMTKDAEIPKTVNEYSRQKMLKFPKWSTNIPVKP